MGYNCIDPSNVYRNVNYHSLWLVSCTDCRLYCMLKRNANSILAPTEHPWHYIAALFTFTYTQLSFLPSLEPTFVGQLSLLWRLLAAPLNYKATFSDVMWSLMNEQKSTKQGIVYFLDTQIIDSNHDIFHTVSHIVGSWRWVLLWSLPCYPRYLQWPPASDPKWLETA